MCVLFISHEGNHISSGCNSQHQPVWSFLDLPLTQRCQVSSLSNGASADFLEWFLTWEEGETKTLEHVVFKLYVHIYIIIIISIIIIYYIIYI